MNTPIPQTGNILLLVFDQRLSNVKNIINEDFLINVKFILSLILFLRFYLIGF